MKDITREVMRNLPTPTTPLADQRRIVSKVGQLMALADQLESQLTASRTAAESLLEALVSELTAMPDEGKGKLRCVTPAGARNVK